MSIQDLLFGPARPFDEIEEAFYTAGEDVLQIFVCYSCGKVRPVDKPNAFYAWLVKR